MPKNTKTINLRNSKNLTLKLKTFPLQWKCFSIFKSHFGMQFTVANM